jgi:hypothetical protein
MTHHDGHRQMDAARIRAELTVQDLWLRYLALGGANDAFDIDGFLQGLVPLDTFQCSVLAQALNEALTDSYDRYRIALAPPAELTGTDEARLRDFIHELLDQPRPGRQPD